MDMGNGRAHKVGLLAQVAVGGTSSGPLLDPAAHVRSARGAVRRRRYLNLLATVLMTAGWIVVVLFLLRTVLWVGVLEPFGLTDQVSVKVVDVQPEHPTAEGVRLWGVTVEWTMEGITHHDTRSVNWNPERGTYYLVAVWGDHVSLYGPRWVGPALAVVLACRLPVLLVQPWRSARRFRDWGKVCLLVGTGRPMPMLVTEVRETQRFINLRGRPWPALVSTISLEHQSEGSRYRPSLSVRDRSGGIRPQVGDALLQWAVQRDHDWRIVILRPSDDTWWAATSYYFGAPPPPVS